MKKIQGGKGFTLIELLVVTSMTAILATLVTVNFVRLRTSQELQAGASDMVSKIREVQSNVLSGKLVNATQTATAYELVFNTGGTTYQINKDIGGAKSALETAALTPNMVINQVFVGGVAFAAATLRMESPFAKVFVDSGSGFAANQTLQIDLLQKNGTAIRSIVVDGISGRIGAK